MAGMDESLDFELDDPLLTRPVPPKRRKVIGLDDLLNDYYKEKSRLIEKTKQKKPKNCYSSDEDADDREAKLSEYVNDCHQKIGKIGGEDDMSLWGLRVFGNQKTLPTFAFPELGSCVILQSFINQELNSLVELNIETGETFINGLLSNGWLTRLVHKCGYAEKSLARWMFHLMLYSSEEVLRTSACDFWCDILLPRTKEDFPSIKIDWLPSYSEIKMALEIYGFLLNAPSLKCSSNMEMLHAGSARVGPSQNIRAWIKYVTACCKTRHTHSIFSTLNAEDLVTIVICLFLDRQLVGLSSILSKCLLSVISFFTDKEWSSICERVAVSIACRVPKDINCLRTVESISGVGLRCKQLRSAVAFQFLKACFAEKELGAEDTLRLLISINVKDKSCDIFKIYIYLCLTENWFLYSPILENNQVIREMWGVYLRNCYSQITSTDMRFYASKVRNKASYLLQETARK